MKTAYALFVLGMLSQPGTGTFLYGHYYPPHYSTLSGLPGKESRMVGDFGVRHRTSGRLRLVADLESKIIVDERAWRTIGSAFYHVGLELDVMPRITVDAAHGSWHNVDRMGPRRSYNRVGLQIKL